MLNRNSVRVRKNLLLAALLCAWLGAMAWANGQLDAISRTRSEQEASVVELVQTVIYMREPIEEE